MIRQSSINKCWEEAMKYFLINAYSRNICGKEYLIMDDLTVQAIDYELESNLSSFCPWNIRIRFISEYLPGKRI